MRVERAPPLPVERPGLFAAETTEWSPKKERLAQFALPIGGVGFASLPLEVSQ